MSARASARSCPGGTLDQRRDLQQLEVADDPVGDVEVGVQAQLPEPAPDPPDPLGELLPQRLQGPLQPLLGLLAGCRRRSSARDARRPRPRGGGPARSSRPPGSSARNLPASSRRASRPSAERAASAGIISRRRSRPEAVDQRSQELGRLEAVQLGLDDAVQRGEALDPLAGLGGDLGGFDRRADPDDEVELAPAGDLDHAGEVHLAQLHGRASERAGDRARVLGIHQQAQPGDHVAHLRATQKAVRASPSREGPSREGPGGAVAISNPDTPSQDTAPGAGPCRSSRPES